MKFRTTAIALAVAGTVAAPVAVQAGADEIYASARIGLENVDSESIADDTEVSDLRVRSFGSRFGARGETDLGNGMTGFGRYEWDVDFSDGDTVNDGITIRHRYVGLKGDFGSLLVGQTYHTFYNHIVGPIDLPWWGSGYAMVDYVGRTDNGLTYAGSTGAVSFGATAHFFRESEEDAPDVIELAASFGVGDMTLGVGLRTTERDNGGTTPTGAANIGNSSDEDVLGVTLSGIALGDASLAVAFQSQDDDTSLTAHLGIGNAYLHFSQESIDEDSQAEVGDRDRTQFTLGYTQSLGRKTTMYYEFVSADNDCPSQADLAAISADADCGDFSALRAVLKYDII